MNLLKYFIGASVLFFASCGGDSSSSSQEKNTGNANEAQSLEDLPHCTKSHFGEIVFVTDSSAYFQCTSEGWSKADSSVVEEMLLSSSSVKTQKNSSASRSSSSSIKVTSSDVQKVEVVKVDSVKVLGFAQVGPFLSGSSVTMYGLDSALDVLPTKFVGKVEGDSGRYSVAKVSLDNQFAKVEAQGFFNNFVSGKKTSGTKTKINAIVDLSDAKTSMKNVNVLSHLEYARAKYLVLNNDFNVPAAKSRAFKELMRIFGKGYSGSALSDEAISKMSATDISLGDSTQAGAALIASAVMINGSLSMSKFASRLSEVADDFATDGAWNDSVIRASVADFLNSRDSLDAFADIRKNLKALNVSAKVPDFESVLRAFWIDEYGLPACVDSLETEVRKNQNKESDSYGAGFVCTSNRWHRATKLDTEFGLCTKNKEGAYKELKLEKSSEYYVCNAGSWNEISKTAFELKSCTSDRNEEYVKAASGEMFVCLDKQWVELDAVAFELKLCTESRNEKVEKTKDGKFYACYNKEWIDASEQDYKIGYPCVSGAKNNREKVDDKFYRCDGSKWESISEDMFEIGLCISKTIGSCEAGVSGSYYECVKGDDYEWVPVSELHCEIGDCEESNDGDVVLYKGAGYACKDLAWNVCNSGNVNAVENKLACVDSTVNNEHTYAWRKASNYELIAQKVCNENLVAKSNEDWIYTTDKKNALYCMDGCAEMFCGSGIHDYYWAEATDVELKTGMRCNSSVADTVRGAYVCRYSYEELEYTWLTASVSEQLTKKVCRENYLGAVEYTKKGNYACVIDNDGLFNWREADLFDSIVGASCYKDVLNKTKTISGNKYSCRSNTDATRYFWVLAFSDTNSGAVKKSYEAVAIGRQVWMTSNLNSSRGWPTYAANDPNGTKYGAYYPYNAKGKCPEGWRIPEESDIDTLRNFLKDKGVNHISALRDSIRNIGGKGVINGTNDYGFSAIGTAWLNDCSSKVVEMDPSICKDSIAGIGNDYFWINKVDTVAYYFNIGRDPWIVIETDVLEEVIKTSNGSKHLSRMPHKLPIRCIRK